MDFRTSYERLYRAIGLYIMRNETELEKLKRLQEELEELYLDNERPPITLAPDPEPDPKKE